jgi:ribosome maturation factor RimP
MIKEGLIKELEELISLFLGRQVLELVDLAYNYEGRNFTLRILADKPGGGITLGECALLNRQLRVFLDEKNIIDGDYVLEVFSPGLDRPLTKQKDFLRCLNKEAVFFLNDLVNGKLQWQGLISKVDEHSVFIQNGGQILEVPLIKINKAQLVI